MHTVCSDLAGSKRILEVEESTSAKALRWEATLVEMKRAPLATAQGARLVGGEPGKLLVHISWYCCTIALFS